MSYLTWFILAAEKSIEEETSLSANEFEQYYPNTPTSTVDIAQTMSLQQLQREVSRETKTEMCWPLGDDKCVGFKLWVLCMESINVFILTTIRLTSLFYLWKGCIYGIWSIHVAFFSHKKRFNIQNIFRI